MGAGIAQVTVDKSYNVILKDISQESVAKGYNQILKGLQKKKIPQYVTYNLDITLLY